MQEGLTNITKHAAATHVDLQLWRDGGTVHGLLRDDGVGFAVEHVLDQTGSRGLGLLGIQERLEALGGTLQIISAPGQGTTLQITLPVDSGVHAQGPSSRGPTSRGPISQKQKISLKTSSIAPVAMKTRNFQRTRQA